MSTRVRRAKAIKSAGKVIFYTGTVIFIFGIVCRIMAEVIK